MLGVLLFIGFWALLGLGFFVAAMRSGPSRAGGTWQVQTAGGRRIVWLTLMVFYVAFGVAIPLGFLIGNHANASSQVGGLPLTKGQKAGREVFGQHCGICHTLAAANAVGKVGPNLDDIQPTAALTLRTINYGCLQNALPTSPQSCLGEGTMPAGIIQGKQAAQVASFVARVAGKE